MACCGPGLPQRVEYLKKTPFILLSSGDGGDDAITELAKLCIITNFGKGKPFALPAKAVEGGAFALICTGGLGNPVSSELTHRPGDFWHTSSSVSVLVAKMSTRIMFVPVSAIKAILAKGDSGGSAEQTLLKAITEMNISSILDNVPYMRLAHLESDSLGALKPLFMFEAYADGVHIYETGEMADRLYILVHGEIAVLDKDGKTVRSFKAPNFFGATAMLDAKATRTFTAAASGGACALLSLSRDKLKLFKELFKESGAQLETLMFQEARGRMLTTTLLKGGMLTAEENAGKLKDSDEQVSRYIALGGCVHVHPRVPAGQALVEAGKVSPAVFFVYQGKLYTRPYDAPAEEVGSEPSGLERRGSSMGSSTRGTKEEKGTPRPADEGKKGAKKVDAPDEPDDALLTGKYVGELGLLKSSAEPSPLVAGPGLVALAAEGEGFKRLVGLVPTLKAHVGLRCIDVERMGYDEVFGFPAASQTMLDHMKSEYSDEAWYFYKASKAWVAAAKGEPPPAPAAALESAREIVEEYIANNAPRQVNLPADCQKRILEAVGAGAVEPTLLDEANKEMKKLVQRDTLPRLRKTEAFRTLVLTTLAAHPEERQFEDPSKFHEAIDRAAVQAAAFPTYVHSITDEIGGWQQYETDM